MNNSQQHADTEDPGPDLVVIERSSSDYQWMRRQLREFVEGETKSAELARWLADPRTGRFLVFDWLAQSLEDVVHNAQTEEELGAYLEGKVRSYSSHRASGTGLTLNIALHVSIGAGTRLEASFRGRGADAIDVH